MKKLILLVLIVQLVSCTNSNKNFEKYEWITQYYIENDYGNYEISESTLFRDKSTVSYSLELSKEVTYPIELLDSTIVIKQNMIIGSEEKGNQRDTIFIDTLLYDFKYILNKPVLVLKSLDMDYLSVLKCSDENARIDETNNFLESTTFKIGGLSIGDSINKDFLVDVEDIEDSFLEEGLSEGFLAEDENIKVELINKKFIYSIEQSMIEEDAIENIIKVINSKVTTQLDTVTIRDYDPFYEEGFKWVNGEVNISLTKKDMSQYYLDRAEEETRPYMVRLYGNLALENVSNKDYWTLEYDNTLIQEVMKLYFKSDKPMSTIIE